MDYQNVTRKRRIIASLLLLSIPLNIHAVQTPGNNFHPGEPLNGIHCTPTARIHFVIHISWYCSRRRKKDKMKMNSVHRPSFCDDKRKRKTSRPHHDHCTESAAKELFVVAQ